MGTLLMKVKLGLLFEPASTLLTGKYILVCQNMQPEIASALQFHTTVVTQVVTVVFRIIWGMDILNMQQVLVFEVKCLATLTTFKTVLLSYMVLGDFVAFEVL